MNVSFNIFVLKLKKIHDVWIAAEALKESAHQAEGAVRTECVASAGQHVWGF